MAYPNTLDDSIELAQQYFGAAELSTRKFNNATVNRQLANDVYREVIRECMCGTTDIQTITTVAGTQEYVNETDYLANKEVWIENTDGYRTPLNPDWEKNKSYGLGSPDSYYLTNTGIGFSPIPSSVMTIKRSYFVGQDEDIAGTDELALIPAQFRKVVAEGLAAQFFFMDKTEVTGGYEKWTRKYEATKLKIRDWMLNGQHQGTYISIG